jgi:hypothetical protein
VHHYQIVAIFIPLTRFDHPLSAACQALLAGISVEVRFSAPVAHGFSTEGWLNLCRQSLILHICQGIARWGMDAMFEPVATNDFAAAASSPAIDCESE